MYNLMTKELADYALRQCKMLYRLSISKIKEDVDIRTLFWTLEEHGHNITELEFFDVKLKESSVESCHLLEMPTVFGQLTSLKLAQYVGRASTVEMQNLGNLCSNLQHLDLVDYSPLCKEELNVLLFGLKDSLISLKLPCISAERQDEFQVESSPFVYCNMLEKLWLNGGLNVKDIMTIGQLVTLKELKFAQLSDGVVDEDYKQTFEQQHLNCLQHLELHGHDVHRFGNKATSALLKNCPNLTYWSCHHFQVYGFAEAVADCGPNMMNLQKLAFHHCTFGLRDLQAVLSLCNLKELHIIGHWEDDYVRKFDNNQFEQVNLISLETLTLDSCRGLDSKGFKALMKSTAKLRNVKLDHIQRVNGYRNIFLECNLEHLENFQAFNCPGLLARDVGVLKQRCPRLRKIVHKEERNWGDLYDQELDDIDEIDEIDNYCDHEFSSESNDFDDYWD
jgi:hypothetical protein